MRISSHLLSYFIFKLRAIFIIATKAVMREKNVPHVTLLCIIFSYKHDASCVAGDGGK